jgi:hypothetical protein
MKQHFFGLNFELKQFTTKDNTRHINYVAKV